MYIYLNRPLEEYSCFCLNKENSRALDGRKCGLSEQLETAGYKNRNPSSFVLKVNGTRADEMELAKSNLLHGKQGTIRRLVSWGPQRLQEVQGALGTGVN